MILVRFFLTSYEYDIEVPKSLQCLQDVTNSDDHELFDLKDDNINLVVAMIIELGDEQQQVVHYLSAHVMSQDSLLKKSLL
jgi:hypothetical protein